MLYSKAVVSYTKVIELLPENSDAYYQRALAYFESKNYKGTLSDMNRFIEIKNTETSLPYLIRGYAKLGLNQQDEACKDWERALQLGSEEAGGLIKNFCK